MIQRKKRIVLFLPHRADPGRGERFSADLLPLELLQIASGPVADGYEVVMIDAMIEEDYKEKVLEACDGALTGTSQGLMSTRTRAMKEHAASMGPLICDVEPAACCLIVGRAVRPTLLN